MTDLDAIRARHMWNRHGRHADIACATCTVLAALDAANEQARLAHIDWAITASELTDAIEREARLRAALVETLALAVVADDGDPWFAKTAGIDADAVIRQARDALAAFEEKA